jgi:hypothetical protein
VTMMACCDWLTYYWGMITISIQASCQSIGSEFNVKTIYPMRSDLLLHCTQQVNKPVEFSSGERPVLANQYIRCTLCVHRFSLKKYPCLDMKNIQGIISNKIANLTLLPRPLHLLYKLTIMIVWLSGWPSFRTRKNLGYCILSKKV